MNTLDRTTVQHAMSVLGYGQYANQYAGDFTNYLQNFGVTVDAVKGYASDQRIEVDDLQARAFVDMVTALAVADEPVIDTAHNVEWFADFRSHAADVIRDAAYQYGVGPESVTQVLIDAGLEDEQPDVVEDMIDNEDNTLARIMDTLNTIADEVRSLSSFARSNGYRG